MRIVQVAYPLAPVGPDAVGGAEQVLAALDAAVAAAGHESVVVAQRGSGAAGRLVPIPPPEGPLDDRAHRQAHAAIRAALRELDADVVHLHGVDFHAYLPPPGPAALVTLHLPLAWYPRAALAPSRPRTFLHCVSPAQAREFDGAAALLPPIANGVALDRFRPRGRKRGFALALGRVSPEKGLHLALLAARRAGVPLLLGGQVFPYPEHRRHFEQDVAPQLDRERRFVGPLGLARKRRLLAAARCLVVPSLVQESSSLVAMEALASGTPVVAFPSGALAEIVEHGKTGFLVRTVPELADAIRASAELRPEDCRAAAEARFDLRRTAASYLARYEALAGSRPAPTRAARRPLRLELLAPAELPRLEPAWRELWERCDGATPFQHPAWLLAWYEHLSFGGGVVLAAWRGRELAGLAPLHGFRDGARRLLGLAGGPLSDYRDALAAPGDHAREEVASALLARAARGDLADGVVLDDLPPGAALLAAAAPRGARDELEPAQRCPELSLEGGAAAIWSRFQPRQAKNLRYEQRRIAREAEVRHELADAGTLPEVLDALFALHAARWRARGEPGLLAHPAVRRFHEASAPRLLAAGLLRLHALRVDGRLVAVSHGLTGRQRAAVHGMAFDPALAHRSPGALLCVAAIEHAATEGCVAFDFLRGEEPYKLAFGARSRTTWRRRLAPDVSAARAVPTV